jgi:hypothetical protein
MSNTVVAPVVSDDQQMLLLVREQVRQCCGGRLLWPHCILVQLFIVLKSNLSLE